MSLLSQFFGGASGSQSNKPPATPILSRIFWSSDQLVIPRDGWYQIVGVGAGGSGGLALLRGSAVLSCLATGGAAGADMKDVYWLTAGTTVTVVVGAAGSAVNPVSNTTSQGINGIAGGTTTIQIGSRPLITLGGGEGGKGTLMSSTLTGAQPGTATGLSYTPQKAGRSGDIDVSGSGGSTVRVVATGGTAPNVIGRSETDLKTGSVTLSVSAGSNVVGVATGGGSPGGGSADVVTTSPGNRATGGGGMGGRGTGEGSSGAGPDIFGNTSTSPVAAPSLSPFNLSQFLFNLFGNGGAGYTSVPVAGALDFSTSPGGAVGGLATNSSQSNSSVTGFKSGPMAGGGGLAATGRNTSTSTLGADAGFGAGGGGAAIHVGSESGSINGSSFASGKGGAAFVMIMEL